MELNKNSAASHQPASVYYIYTCTVCIGFCAVKLRVSPNGIARVLVDVHVHGGPLTRS